MFRILILIIVFWFPASRTKPKLLLFFLWCSPIPERGYHCLFKCMKCKQATASQRGSPYFLVFLEQRWADHTCYSSWSQPRNMKGSSWFFSEAALCGCSVTNLNKLGPLPSFKLLNSEIHSSSYLLLCLKATSHALPCTFCSNPNSLTFRSNLVGLFKTISIS